MTDEEKELFYEKHQVRNTSRNKWVKFWLKIFIKKIWMKKTENTEKDNVREKEINTK